MSDELFWSRVLVGDGCWEWTGGVSSAGYGNLERRGKQYSAHRYAYHQAVGSWPEMVLHSCDNRLCCRPSHLRAVNQVDNMHDMVVRGRSSHGEKNIHAKLSREAVIRLREGKAAGYTSKELAYAFGVTLQQVHHICSGKQRRHE